MCQVFHKMALSKPTSYKTYKNGDFENLKQDHLKTTEHQKELNKILCQKMSRGDPDMFGGMLINDLKTVRNLLDKCNDLVIGQACLMYLNWKERAAEEATYGALKQALSEIKRNDLKRDISDKKDESKVEDRVFIPIVAKKLAPQDINGLGIQLIGNYTNICSIIHTANTENKKKLTAAEEAYSILAYWLNLNSSEANGDCLMNAVLLLDSAQVKGDVYRFLLGISEQGQGDASAAATNATSQLDSRPTASGDETDALMKAAPLPPATEPAPPGESTGDQREQLQDTKPVDNEKSSGHDYYS